MKNKKAISLMISYVLLIAIAIGTSIAVYSWIKVMSNPNQLAECKEETSLYLSDYECHTGGFSLKVRNSGRFNISGFLIIVSNDSGKEPILAPFLENPVGQPGGSKAGVYYFTFPLKPGSENNLPVRFTNMINKNNNRVAINSIEKIQLQPFITSKKSNKIIACQNAVIKQKIESCVLT